MRDAIALESALIGVSSLATAAMVLDEPEERSLLIDLITLIQKIATEATEAQQ
ncbi:hypothetical protein [Rahnella sp. ChDrAdgB13]|uniref:hypothetical protein n=1 Tax=Rahnella sp. ChDrAdgB13 TaxID=1850581 RepID=UPI001AD8871A|nr:hypothetical protein [Rahnella sp. ChDrAdgB13]